MTELRVYCPRSFLCERQYILDVILGRFLGLEYELSWADATTTHVELALGERRLRVRDDFLHRDERLWMQPESLPHRPPPSFELTQVLDLPDVPARVPVLYGAPSLCREGEDLELGIDVFAAAFFMLSRYEELVVPVSDAHARFPAEASYAHTFQFLSYPLINVYVELLWSCMSRLWPGLTRKPRDNRTFISCDVDVLVDPLLTSLTHSTRVFAHNLVRRRSLKTALWGARASLSVLIRGQDADPNLCFDYYMSQVERANLRAAFYFIAGRTQPEFDARYDMSDPLVTKLLVAIHQRGHEIGLHPSYHTYRSSEAIAGEFASLRGACTALDIEQAHWGGRHHYLRWEPQTWARWEMAGLSYDSTLSYAACAGFRAGICYDYPAYDLEARQPLALMVRPLVAMEVSLMSPRYMGLDHAQTADRLRRFRRLCRLFHGDFTLLWHNSSFVQPEDRAVFEAIVSGAA